MLFPPPLKRGDTIAVIAPSSPFEHVLGWRGLGFLAERYRVLFDRRALFARRGYLAGDDGARRDALTAALEDPDVSAILAARGGYGANRFAHGVDFTGLRTRPRWIIGFSDVTALHVEAARAGVASLHACHLTALGRSDARARAGLVDALEAPTRTRAFDGLGPVEWDDASTLGVSPRYSELRVPLGGHLFSSFTVKRACEETDVVVSLATIKSDGACGVTSARSNKFGMKPISYYGA